MDDSPGIGHNSIGPDAKQLLTSYVERVENVESEIKDLQNDRKDIYAEAKAQGLDVKTLRKVIQRRRMDKAERDEQDALLELYEGVFG